MVGQDASIERNFLGNFFVTPCTKSCPKKFLSIDTFRPTKPACYDYSQRLIISDNIGPDPTYRLYHLSLPLSILVCDLRFHLQLHLFLITWPHFDLRLHLSLMTWPHLDLQLLIICIIYSCLDLSMTTLSVDTCHLSIFIRCLLSVVS